MTTAFILASWRPDAPAGMERAVIAHAAALRIVGASAVIVTADHTAPDECHGVAIYRLCSLDVAYPCDDITLRGRIDAAVGAITAELGHLFHVDAGVTAAVYVDALWGFGRIMPRYPDVRNVLAAHVVGHDEDLRQALSRNPARVIAPSGTVLAQAAARGYDTTEWTVVPNTLLSVPTPTEPADRERLRVAGSVRVLARLGAEKGVEQLLSAPTGYDRPVHVALAVAPFEPANGSQERLRQTCHRLAAATPGVTIRPGMPWDEVPAWLGDAALVVVPSQAETFGLVALEAMASGTPVVAYDVGNLPALVAEGGIIVAREDGPAGLWRVARRLLCDPVLYGAKSRAAYYRSRDYWPAHIADQLLKVVS